LLNSLVPQNPTRTTSIANANVAQISFGRALKAAFI